MVRVVHDTFPFVAAIQLPTTPYRKLDVRESGFGI
jgi:hypothetical protein